MRIVFLILASPGFEYDQFKKIIHEYLEGWKEEEQMHYFLYGNNSYQTEFKYEKNDLVLPYQDSWNDGMIGKTILACKYLLETDLQFDYCVRTNLSSIFHRENIFQLIVNFPKTKCYHGLTGALDS